MRRTPLPLPSLSIKLVDSRGNSMEERRPKKEVRKENEEKKNGRKRMLKGRRGRRE
jgi:hypothetical protein